MREPPYVIDTLEKENMFPESQLVKVTEDQVAVVVEDSFAGLEGHLFNREDGGLRYIGVMSERGTFTHYDEFREKYRPTAAELVDEETPYTIKNRT